MGQGCPVLAARAASLPEVCGDAALYCDPADPADMARALVQLLDDAALRQRLRAAGPAAGRALHLGRQRKRAAGGAAACSAVRRRGPAVKVLQISKFYPPHHGGIEAVARDLSAGLVARGVAVEVLCANKRLRQADDTDALGVRVTRAASAGLLLSTSMAPGLLPLLRARRQQADIVHVHMPDPLAALAVWYARPTRARGAALAQRRRAPAAGAPRLPAAGALAAAARRRRHRHQRTLCRVVAHAAALAAQGACGAAGHATAAAGAAAAGGRSAGDATAAAASSFRSAASRTTRASTCWCRPRATCPTTSSWSSAAAARSCRGYRALAQQHGVAERVRFIGPMSAARVEAHFAAAELFCLASTVRAEAYGVAVLEAMARGLPVVASRIPGSGLNWLHQDGVTGLAVPPGDAACAGRGAEPPARRRRAAPAVRAGRAGPLGRGSDCTDNERPDPGPVPGPAGAAAGRHRPREPPLKILLEMRPALDGHAGIPQEARLLFRGLSTLDGLHVEGLLQSSNRVISMGLPPPGSDRLATPERRPPHPHAVARGHLAEAGRAPACVRAPVRSLA